MKKSSLIIGSVLFISTTFVNAQEDSREHIQLGGKYGLTAIGLKF